MEYDDIQGSALITVAWPKDYVISTAGCPYCNTERCQIFDAEEIKSGPGDESLFLTTHVLEINEEKTCDEKRCPASSLWKEISSKQYFVADVENLTLAMTHFITAHHFHEQRNEKSSEFSVSSDQMTGALVRGYGKSKQVLKNFRRELFNSISLKQVLAAANVSLDEVQFANNTLRRTGCTLSFQLSYSNYKSSDISDYFSDDGNNNTNGSYVKIFRKIFSEPNYAPNFRIRIFDEGHFYSQTTTHYSDSRNTRTRIITNGILIQLKQHGKLGRFSFMALIIKLASVGGFLTLISTIVDYFGLLVPPKNETSVSLPKVKYEQITKPKKE